MRQKISNLPHRPCPICGSQQAFILYEQDFFGDFTGSLLSGYDVVICKECGFGFADHLPLQEKFDLYYANYSKYEGNFSSRHDNSFNTSRFEVIVRAATRYIPEKTTKILDVGCATGGLLAKLKYLGYTNLTGLDPSPECARLALQEYGIPVVTGSIHELIKLEKKFDFVTLIGTLEHICDLDAAVKEITSIIGNRGRVLIEVPDATRFIDFIDAPFQQFSIEHINFFSQISLENLMRKHGFLQIHTENFDHPINGFSVMPVVSSVFLRDENKHNIVVKDQYTHYSLARYIKASSSIENNIQETINNLIQENIPIIVWGVGTHTQRLLSDQCLGKANITNFVDSNPKYQGLDIMGIPILAPRDIINLKESILISSQTYQNEIEQTIRDELMMGNNIIKLYL